MSEQLKVLVLNALTAFVASVVIAIPARAAPLVDVDYEFTITSTLAGFPAPTTIIGHAVFNLDAPGFGSYPIISHSVSFGGTPITSDPGPFGIFVRDNAAFTPPRDTWTLSSSFDDVFGSIQLVAISFALQGDDTRFSGQDLFVPNPSDFPIRHGTVVFSDGTGGGNLGVQADLSNVRFIVQQVPEPATLALLGIALAGLGFNRRKRG